MAGEVVVHTDEALADLDLLRVQMKALQQRAADLEAAHFRTEESLRLLRVEQRALQEEQEALNARLEKMAESLTDVVEQ